MPRSPKKEHLDNPLRKLREALGTQGKPMPQWKLAAALKLPLETLKSIELGRFREGIPSPQTMEFILSEFGAHWVEKRKEWDFILPGIPYTLANYERWKKASFDRETEIDTLCAGLISLLQRATDSQFASASDAVYRALHEIAKKSGVSVMDPDFLRMDLAIVNIWPSEKHTRTPADIIGFRRERDCHEPKPKEALFDFRDKLKPAAPVTPSSRQRSARSGMGGAPRTSSPRPR
jgi:hypothetical protein